MLQPRGKKQVIHSFFARHVVPSKKVFYLSPDKRAEDIFFYL